VRREIVRRSILGATLALAVAMLAAPVLAGGYATVRLDEPPGDVVAGTPFRFGFTVRQHDVTPTNDVTPIVRARNMETGEEITANARQEGTVGHFVAELTLPTAGNWKWAVYPEPFAETSFESLHVVDDRASTQTPDALHLLDASALAATPAPSVAETIEIVGGGSGAWLFQPRSITIARGDVVAWVNVSDSAHTITGDDLSFADSGVLDPGQTFQQTFDQPGTYHYRCGPHPWMEGDIIVE
jgi:plastocyanin